MNQFWAFILFDEAGYTTNMTEAHAHLNLNKELVDRWVNLFHATIDSNFTGEKAELAKQKASLIGWTMAIKFQN